MTTGWDDFVARYWDTAPCVLPWWEAEPPVDLDRCYRTVLAAAQPFRAGTRFRALPDVRFFSGGGRIAAPGDLLPGPDDETAELYAGRLAGTRYVLNVRQPLALDFRMWAEVRDLVSPLWRRAGFPVLPVDVEMTMASGHPHRDERGDEATHTVLTWVLRGRLEARLRRAADEPEQTLVAGSGHLLYWPAPYHYEDHYGDDCLVLRLRVPADRRLPVAAVKDVLADLAQHGRDGDAVPYLPYPPRRRADGSVAPAAPLVAAEDLLTGAREDRRLQRALRIMWARRVSAYGLEMPPAPRDAVTLRPDQRIRSSAEIVRMTEETGESIWAVNGHVFTVRGTAADAVVERLGEPVTVAELAGEDDRGVLALLEKLYRVRGIEPVGG
ncbi:hypothetical protein [Sphaerisporangium fuscum]|uniref:hypothetical protein n=1 Tax=Sphaerisporangium fuscum TaxID=2835868 RepID=UPI001BDCAF2B|nr:hypothetical protein [Sphaerisporangium fuscum]